MQRSIASSDHIPRLLPLQTLFKHLRHHQDNSLTSKNNLLYLYFNKQKLKPHLDSLYTTHASKNLAFCPHIFSILYSLRTISSVKLHLQWPRGTTCAHKLRYTGFTIMQLNTHYLQHCSQLKSSLTAKVDRQNIKFHFFKIIFLLFMYVFLYIHLQINILMLSLCLNSTPRQVFCVNFSRRIQIL